MKWVYCICYVGDRFVMVFNPTRKGWEMPGGRIEEDEAAEQAAIREVREECGCEMLPVANMMRRDGAVFCGELTCPSGAEKEAEMAWDLFSELPTPLAFGEDEYSEVLTWSKLKMEERRSASKGFRSCL